MNRRPTLPVVLSLVATLLFVACGGPQATGSPAGSVAPSIGEPSAAASLTESPGTAACPVPAARADAIQAVAHTAVPSGSAPVESPSLPVETTPPSTEPSLEVSTSAAPTEAPTEPPAATPPPAAGPTPAPNTEVSGSITTLFFGATDEVGQSRLDAFQAAYPNVTVNVTEGGFDPQVLQTALTAGTPPDVINLPRDVFGTYAAQGALLSLDTFISESGLDMGIYRDPAVAQVTYNGQVYGIPEFYDVRVLIINDSLLEAAGLTADDVDTTDWNRLEEVNQQLTLVEDGNVCRLGFDPKLPEFLPVWAAANGASLISEDGLTSNLEDPKVAEALAYTASLHDPAGGRAQFDAFRQTWDFFGSGNQVAADQLGAWPMEQWYIDVLAEVSPDEDITVKPFTDRQGNALTYQTGSAWAIPTNAPNAAAAYAFAQFMTSTDAWLVAAQAKQDARESAGAPSIGIWVANEESMDRILTEIVEPAADKDTASVVAVLREASDNAISIPLSPAGQEFDTIWREAVENVLTGGMDAQEALTAADQEAQSALDRAAQ